MQAMALTASKLDLSTMSVGPISVYYDNHRRVKLVFMFGTVLITDPRHSFGYNETNKLCVFYSSPEAFRQSKFFAALDQLHPGEARFNPWSAADTTKANGWSLTRYSRGPNAAAVERSPRLSAYREVVSATHDLTLPYEWVNAYVEALGAPCPAGSFPLYFYAYMGQQVVQRRLELINATNVNVDAGFFSEPQGYKQTNDDMKVFLSGGNFEKLMKLNHPNSGN
jgi:hypothetical protein